MLLSIVLLVILGQIAEVCMTCENGEQHTDSDYDEGSVDAFLPSLLFLDDLIRLALPLKKLAVERLHIIFIF